MLAAIPMLLTSCDKNKEDSNLMLVDHEDIEASHSMDLAIKHMITYHDSTFMAKMHSSKYIHHYDSMYHHYDSLYSHHHAKYHHGDTSHHLIGYHHTLLQHHIHDSINKVHHHKNH